MPIELVPTRKERWIRLAWPWGALSAVFLAQVLGTQSWWGLPLALAIGGMGAREFLSPRLLKLDSFALELTRYGRTVRIPWRNVAYALPGAPAFGPTVQIFLNRAEVLRSKRLMVNVRYGYGHSSDDLAKLINDARATAVPDEPHPLPEKKLKKFDRAILIVLSALIVVAAVLALVFGRIP